MAAIDGERLSRLEKVKESAQKDKNKAEERGETNPEWCIFCRYRETFGGGSPLADGTFLGLVGGPLSGFGGSGSPSASCGLASRSFRQVTRCLS